VRLDLLVVLRHLPDPVAFGLAPGPVTGRDGEINPEEFTRRLGGAGDRCGPTTESITN
jgi:hypothetical protein